LAESLVGRLVAGDEQLVGKPVAGPMAGDEQFSGDLAARPAGTGAPAHRSFSQRKMTQFPDPKFSR